MRRFLTNCLIASPVCAAATYLLIDRIGWWRTFLLAGLLGTLTTLYVEDRREVEAERNKR